MMRYLMEATLVFHLKKFIDIITQFLSRVMDAVPRRSRRNAGVRARPKGSIRSRWLRMIVHETKSDRRMRVFGRDPLR